MVCPKLAAGTCKITKKPCTQKYEIKMVRYKDCKIYKKGKGKVTSKKKTPKKKRR